MSRQADDLLKIEEQTGLGKTTRELGETEENNHHHQNGEH